MIRRYRLVLNVPNYGDRCFDAVTIGSFRTLEMAFRRAEMVLAKYAYTETIYRRESWVHSCTVYDNKKGALLNGRGILAMNPGDEPRLDAPVQIVPSVGELGWTP